MQNNEASLSKNLDLLIAIRLENVTNIPSLISPIPNFISFDKQFSSNRSFLSELNPIKIPK